MATANSEEIEKGLMAMLEQCKAYLLVLPKENVAALAMAEQFKNQLSSLLNEVESLKAAQNAPASDTLNPLTNRENQVLLLIAEGHANKEIAYQLSISPKTVQFHIKSIFSKLDASSRTEVVTKAIKAGIITL